LLNVEGFPLQRHWHAVHLSEKKLSLVAQTFLDFLTDETADIMRQANQFLDEGGHKLALFKD